MDLSIQHCDIETPLHHVADVCVSETPESYGRSDEVLKHARGARAKAPDRLPERFKIAYNKSDNVSRRLDANGAR